MQCRGNMVDEAKHPSQTPIIFVESVNLYEHYYMSIIWHCHDEKWRLSYWSIPDTFWRFSPSIYPTVNNTCLNRCLNRFCCSVVAHSTLSPSNSTKCRALPSLDVNLPLKWSMAIDLACSMTFYARHYYNLSIFRCLLWYASKMDRIRYIANRWWKCDQYDFFSVKLFRTAPKHQTFL